MTRYSGKRPIEPVEVRIGHMIRMQRLLRGFSQQDLARRLGVTFQQVQKYEKATTHIASSRLYEIARIIGAPIEIFFKGPDPERPFQAVIGGIVDQYRSISPQFGIHEFMELNRALVDIADPAVRLAVEELVDELASGIGDRPQDRSQQEQRGIRPSFRRRPARDGDDGAPGQPNRRAENVRSGSPSPVDVTKAIT